MRSTNYTEGGGAISSTGTGETGRRRGGEGEGGSEEGERGRREEEEKGERGRGERLVWGQSRAHPMQEIPSGHVVE